MITIVAVAFVFQKILLLLTDSEIVKKEIQNHLTDEYLESIIQKESTNILDNITEHNEVALNNNQLNFVNNSN